MHTEANFDARIEFDALLAGKPTVIGSDEAPAVSYWDSWNCFDYTPQHRRLKRDGGLHRSRPVQAVP